MLGMVGVGGGGERETSLLNLTFHWCSGAPSLSAEQSHRVQYETCTEAHTRTVRVTPLGYF